MYNLSGMKTVTYWCPASFRFPSSQVHTYLRTYKTSVNLLTWWCSQSSARFDSRWVRVHSHLFGAHNELFMTLVLTLPLVKFLRKGWGCTASLEKFLNQSGFEICIHTHTCVCTITCFGNVMLSKAIVVKLSWTKVKINYARLNKNWTISLCSSTNFNT